MVIRIHTLTKQARVLRFGRPWAGFVEGLRYSAPKCAPSLRLAFRSSVPIGNGTARRRSAVAALQAADHASMTTSSAFVSAARAKVSPASRVLSNLNRCVISESLAQVQGVASGQAGKNFSVAAFIADAARAAGYDAQARGCVFTVPPVHPSLAIEDNPDRLLAALANLLQNAFKLTQKGCVFTLELPEQALAPVLMRASADARGA